MSTTSWVSDANEACPSTTSSINNTTNSTLLSRTHTDSFKLSYTKPNPSLHLRQVEADGVNESVAFRTMKRFRDQKEEQGDDEKQFHDDGFDSSHHTSYRTYHDHVVENGAKLKFATTPASPAATNTEFPSLPFSSNQFSAAPDPLIFVPHSKSASSSSSSSSSSPFKSPTSSKSSLSTDDHGPSSAPIYKQTRYNQHSHSHHSQQSVSPLRSHTQQHKEKKQQHHQQQKHFEFEASSGTVTQASAAAVSVDLPHSLKGKSKRRQEFDIDIDDEYEFDDDEEEESESEDEDDDEEEESRDEDENNLSFRNMTWSRLFCKRKQHHHSTHCQQHNALSITNTPTVTVVQDAADTMVTSINNCSHPSSSFSSSSEPANNFITATASSSSCSSSSSTSSSSSSSSLSLDCSLPCTPSPSGASLPVSPSSSSTTASVSSLQLRSGDKHTYKHSSSRHDRDREGVSSRKSLNSSSPSSRSASHSLFSSKSVEWGWLVVLMVLLLLFITTILMTRTRVHHPLHRLGTAEAPISALTLSALSFSSQ